MDEQAKREADEFEAARAKHDQRLTVLEIYFGCPVINISYRLGLITVPRKGMSEACFPRCM